MSSESVSRACKPLTVGETQTGLGKVRGVMATGAEGMKDKAGMKAL